MLQRWKILARDMVSGVTKSLIVTANTLRAAEMCVLLNFPPSRPVQLLAIEPIW